MNRYLDKKIVQSLNKFAIPLIIQFFSNYIINLTDQAIVGRISIEAYSVIGIVNTFNNFIVGIIGCTTVAFNIRSSHIKKQEHTFYYEFMSSILLSSMIGIIFLLFSNIFKRFVLVDIYAITGIELDIGIRYFSIVSPYVLVQMLIFSYGQFFKILNMTKYLLVGSTISALLNILLDYVLVFGKCGMPRMDVEGAALATIISMIVNLLILIIASNHVVIYKKIKINMRNVFKVCIHQLVDSLPLMGQELLEGSVFTMVITSIVSRLGTMELSSYLITQQILKFLYVPMNMYGSAVLTLTGQYESGKKNTNIIIPKIASIISSMIYIFPGILIIIFNSIIPKIITNDLNVINMSSKLIPVVTVCNLIKPSYIVYKNALISTNNSKYVLYISLVVNALTMILTLITVYNMQLSLNGIFICEMVNDIILFWVFYKKYNKLKI